MANKESTELLSDNTKIIVKENEYVWVYEFSLWKNPTVLITIAKIIALSSFFVGLFMFVITAIDDITQAFTVATNVFYIYTWDNEWSFTNSVSTLQHH